LTGTYLNFQLEEILAWFGVERVCQCQLGILVHGCWNVLVFVRDSICYSAYMLSPVRPSVRRVYHRKTVEVRIM